MDDYTLDCIRWLLENNTELLAQYVHKICGANISVVGMDACDVRKIIVDATKDNKQDKTGIKCKKCGENTVTFLEVQARSADEGASVYYSCSSCLSHWKQR